MSNLSIMSRKRIEQLGERTRSHTLYDPTRGEFSVDSATWLEQHGFVAVATNQPPVFDDLEAGSFVLTHYEGKSAYQVDGTIYVRKDP